jgi:hypothetical protein
MSFQMETEWVFFISEDSSNDAVSNPCVKAFLITYLFRNILGSSIHQ